MTPTGRADRELTAKEREPVEPADRIRVPLACQRWEVVSFLHWPYDPAAVRPLVPEPFELDLFDGSAWIGLVPFRMITRPPGLPPIPWLSTFAETNVRTYVRAPDGRRGIWFLSLDVGSASNAAVGALMGLPYRWSAMKIDGGLGERRYASRRLVPGSIVSSVRIIGSAETVRQTELDRFLTARFRLYATGPLGPFVVPVEHAPWRLFHAGATDLRDGLVAAAGLPTPADPPLAYRGADVSVRVGLPSRLGGSSTPASGPDGNADPRLSRTGSG
jgi:uncharacterized protein YqjF (DUF2071 family)